MSNIVRARWAPVVAVTLGVLIIGTALIHVPLDILTHQVHGGEDVTVDWVTAMGFAVPAAVTGAVVAARRPGNPLGWLLLGLFLFGGLPSAGYAFLDYGMHHGTLPLGRVAVALAVAWPVWLFLIPMLLWLFFVPRSPDHKADRQADHRDGHPATSVASPLSPAETGKSCCTAGRISGSGWPSCLLKGGMLRAARGRQAALCESYEHHH